MKGSGVSSFILFLFTVLLLVLRPVIIFSSSAVQSALQTRETKMYGIVKAIRKRQEHYHTPQIISEEVANDKPVLYLLPFLFFALKKWLVQIFNILSFLLSHCAFLLKRRRTVFELSPDNDHYLALSLLRI